MCRVCAADFCRWMAFDMESDEIHAKCKGFYVPHTCLTCMSSAIDAHMPCQCLESGQRKMGNGLPFTPCMHFSRECTTSVQPDRSCGTRHPSRFVLLCWPLSKMLRQHDRFVLIGLCWLYGRSEFPTPSVRTSPPVHTTHTAVHREFCGSSGQTYSSRVVQSLLIWVTATR